MVLVRALTFMSGPINYSDPREAKSHLRNLPREAGGLGEVAKHITPKIWTKRLVLPRLDATDSRSLRELSTSIKDILPDLGVNYVALPLGEVNLEEVADELSTTLAEDSPLFFSVKLSRLGESLPQHRASSAARLLKRIAEKGGPMSCVKFAFSCGDQPETPYFPDTLSSRSSRRSFSLSLRYVKDVQDIIEREPDSAEREVSSLLAKVNGEALEASSRSSLDYIGMDCSLSPWMDESAASLVEVVLGHEFHSPGTHDAVFQLNRLIESASKGVRACGFNEVMLPVAEDSRLKELALDGRVTTSSLVSLVSVCVAGLDMVVLPLSTDLRELAGILLDISSIVNSKRRAAGIRLVLADAKPFDEISMGQFGKVPIMRL